MNQESPDFQIGTFFTQFSTPGPVLAVFPPRTAPFAVQLTEPTFTIGSGRTCNLVIEDGQHAEIALHICRHAFHESDLSVAASANGDFTINTIPLTSRVPIAFRPGDVLRLGEWFLKVVPQGGKESGFEGDLARVPVVALLQSCPTGDQGKGVQITFHYKNKMAAIHFHSGKVIHAEFREFGLKLEGLDAFRRILELSAGKFRVFLNDPFPVLRTLDAPVDALFLEAFSESDSDFRTGEITFQFPAGEKP